MTTAATNNANGRFFRGSFTSPVFTSTDSKPPNANTRSKTVDENEEKSGSRSICSISGSIKKKPTAIKSNNGSNFPKVKKLLTLVVFFTPI